MNRRSRLLTIVALNAALTTIYLDVAVSADLAPEFGTCVDCAVPNAIPYADPGTSGARGVLGPFVPTADCKIGRMVDQFGRVFKIDRSPNSAVEALGFVDRRVNGPVDRSFSDAELVANYWSLCPVGVGGGPSASSQSSGGGGGGSSGGGGGNPTGTTPVVSPPGPTSPTRPTPIIVPPGGGGGGGGPTPPGHNVGVPFPVAGVGLPAILLVGGYVMLRRRLRSRSN